MRPVTTFSFLLLLAPAWQLKAEDFSLHTFKRLHLTDKFYSEGAHFGDFNKDGKTDIVSGPFWYEGPEFKKSHEYYAPKPFNPKGYSNNFFAFTHDLNGDGWDDIIIYGFPGRDASWYENPQGKEGHWKRHKVLNQVDNESPTWWDLTGDGKPEIVCSQGGYFGYASPNWEKPQEPWVFQKVSEKTAGGKFRHGLGVGDVNGDGRMDILELSGWWEQPKSLEGNPVWKRHKTPFGAGGAQMFAYDIDGDGDNDVVTSLAAHSWGLAWYEHIKEDGKIKFTMHPIMTHKQEDNPFGFFFSQMHAVDVLDMDGDGLKDVVTGKRYWAHNGHDPGNAMPAVLIWFRLTRTDKGVEFVPHTIDDDSGIGVQVQAGDLNGDGLPDVVVGNKKGTFIHLQSKRKATKQEWLKTQPQRFKKKSAGLSPKDAVENMTVQEGFKVDLVAGEPQVHQPIAFSIDHKGRLWIAEAHSYPRRQPEGEGKDRIIVLEDGDGDGSFEKRTVFIENLNLVSGMEVGLGGVWVGAAPNLMFIPDRDDDLKPDAVPKILLDGFGYHDTHETLNSFIWGPDGWLYGCHGVFTHSKVGKPGTPDRQRTPLNCGVWRYHPVRHEFEVFAWGTSNPWGLDFDDHGQAFITACVIPHAWHIIQGAYYQRQGGRHFNPHAYDVIKTIADHRHYAGSIGEHAWWGRNAPVNHATTSAAGGGHAHCGALIYLGDAFPPEYRNALFMHNIHGNRINMDVLERKGSGFVATHGKDLMLANDHWFRGIALRTGPEGAVYLIDWYDKNACHRTNPVIWDRSNGRVYRISHSSAGAPRQQNLAALSSDELVKLHLHKNDWYVRMARRLLQERAMLHTGRQAEGSKTTASLSARKELKNILDTNPDVTRRLRALWTLHTIGELDDNRTVALLSDSEEYIRAWSIQLLCESRRTPDFWSSERPAAKAFVRLAREEKSPVVRLYLASALQRLPLEARWPIAEGLAARAEDAGDLNLPLMLWYGIEPALAADAKKALAFGKAAKSPETNRFVARRLARNEEARTVLLSALADEKDTNIQVIYLEELASAAKSLGRLTMPPQWPSAYERLARSRNKTVRDHAQFISAKFGDKRIFPVLRGIAADPKAVLSQRTLALDALITGKDEELPPVLHRLLDDKNLRSRAIKGLAIFEHPETAGQIIRRFNTFSDKQKQEAEATLASRPAFSIAFLKAIEARQLGRDALSAFTVRQILNFNNEEINILLNRVWGAIRGADKDKAAEIARFKKMLSPAVLKNAHPSRGRAVFEKICAQCHMLFGAGGQIGPDITGSNRADLDYILENIIDPNAVVGRDYQMTSIKTKDERTLTGLIAEQNEQAVTLQTTEDKITLARADIEVMKTTENSMMPEELLATLKEPEVSDLIAYLGSPMQVPLPGQGPVYDPKTRRVPGALEGEALRIVRKTRGSARPQKMQHFRDDKWSGVDHLWWTGGKPKDKLVLEFSSKLEAKQEVFIVLTKARDYGIVQLSVNGENIGKPFDLYSPKVVTTGIISLGSLTLKKGNNQFGLELTGRNPKAVPAYMVGLDYVWLGVPKE